MSLVLYMPATRPWGMPNLSPFCTKLELYLRMTKTEHEVRPSDMRKAPKGKIPYVSLDGALMGDSQHIIERLESLKGAAALDAWLTGDQKAQAHVVRRMLDEALYFVGSYLRWMPDESFALLAPEFRKVIPGPFRVLLPLIRVAVRKQLKSQGTGRHTRAEVEAMGIADWTALSKLLGEKPYLMGDKPSTVDASLFGFVESVMGFPGDTAMRRHLLSLSNLVAYRKRIREQWFADLETKN